MNKLAFRCIYQALWYSKSYWLLTKQQSHPNLPNRNPVLFRDLVAEYSGKVGPSLAPGDKLWVLSNSMEVIQWKYPFLSIVIPLGEAGDIVVVALETKEKREVGWGASRK